MFKVIEGGKAASKPSSDERSRRMAQLREIAKVNRTRNQVYLGPRAGRVAAVAFLAFVLASALFFGLDMMGLHNREASTFGPLTITILAGVLTYRYCKLPRTWTELLDNLLLTYEPVDAGAYRALQDSTRHGVWLEPDFVEDWLSVEQNAVSFAFDSPAQHTYGFLNKKV